ncbi:MAG TPA: winged helix-turn-helix transcriptional regulator [bacterium]|nr:winged helix-turn-helix transcriptional regulator [bacterium]
MTFKKRNLSAQETAQETIRKKILQLLKENPGYTKNDLIKILGKSDGTIKKHLANLKNNGLLERVGSTKAGHWKVKSKS